MNIERPEPLCSPIGSTTPPASAALGSVVGRPSRVERVAQRDFFAAALGAADLAARRDRRRHVEDDGPVLAGRRRHAERVGAEQHLFAAPGRHRRRGVGEHHRHQAGFDRGQRVGRGHAEMRAALPTRRRCRTRAPSRWLLRIARMPITKPKPFSPSRVAATGVTRSGSRPARIDQPVAHALEIDRQAAQAVGVDAAQVGADQAARDCRGILGGTPCAASSERAKASAPRRWRKRGRRWLESRPSELDVLDLLRPLRPQPPSRKARSVPVDT